MDRKRYVERTDIKKWKSHGISLLGIGMINAAVGIMILEMDHVPSQARPLLHWLIGGVGFMMFSITFVAGIRSLVRYSRYKRYFITTGLTRCTEDHVLRWLETRDVTQ